MFDLGEGDKEKLEENMEEIKELIQEDSESQGEDEDTQELQQSPEVDEGKPDTDSKTPESAAQSINDFEQDQDFERDETETTEATSDLEQNFETDQEETEDQPPEMDQNFEVSEEDQTGSLEQESNEAAATQETVQKTGESGNIDESLEGIKNEIKRQSEKKQEMEEIEYEGTEVEETEATEKLSKMSQEGNSLFLEVDKFEKVKSLVREMRNLSHDMGTVMDELDERNEEAAETEEEGQSLLSEFEERRDDLERAVSDES